MTASHPDVYDTEPPASVIEPSTKQILFTPRIQSLDVLRGIAVLFALFISIWAFGGFSQNDQNGLLLSSKGFDYRLFGTIDLLFDGKMRALIAIVFGAGMLLFLSKDNRKDEPSTHDLFIRRHMWLILFGIINGLLFLWSQDVLFHLGIMGILLFPFARLSARALLIAATLVTLIYSGKNFWNYADDRKTYNKYVAVTAVEERLKKDSINKSKAIVAAGIKDSTVKRDTLTKKQAGEKGAWEGMVAGMKYDSKKDDGENKAMRATSYASLYNHQMPTLQAREAQWTYQFGIWDFGSMILLGMALFKLGFFTARFSQKQYLLIALIGITAGLLLGWYRLHNHQHTLQDYAKYINTHYLPRSFFFPFERAFMALGYASLVIFLNNARLFKMLWRGFANVGRLALTNYLAQSIICTLFFTGFGAGYFGRLNQYQLYFFVIELFVLQVIFSSLWFRVYHTGPAEWLWRSLIYWKRLPFKKKRLAQLDISISSIF
jgi:uncharacterized protein